MPNFCLALRDQCHANVGKQMLFDGIDVGLPKWLVCGHGLNHEGVNDISNEKVHLKTGSGNVKIRGYLHYLMKEF